MSNEQKQLLEKAAEIGEIEYSARQYEASYYKHTDQHSHAEPKDHYINGALSDAAKDYWFAQFTQPKQQDVKIVNDILELKLSDFQPLPKPPIND